MEARRRNLRALEADTGLSKTTLSELRSGRRRVTRDALLKIVGRYDPDRTGDWDRAWTRVNETSTSVAGTSPAGGASPAGIGTTPMHFVLQTETCLDSCVPSDSAGGTAQLDWIAIYARS